MIKKLTGYLDYGMFAEIALVIFGLVFIAIIIRTLAMRSDVAAEQAKIVLNDSKEPSCDRKDA